MKICKLTHEGTDLRFHLLETSRKGKEQRREAHQGQPGAAGVGSECFYCRVSSGVMERPAVREWWCHSIVNELPIQK